MNNISVSSSVSYLNTNEKFTKYSVLRNKQLLGQVKLIDKPNGVYVSFIQNCQPNIFKGFGKIADQIEVEHCLKRGLDSFEITSEAALNSHACHYLRGKRFGEVKDIAKKNRLLEVFHTADVNKIVKYIIEYTPKGEKCVTNFLGRIPMFMPQDVIKQYIEIIKKHPLLK